MDDLTATLAAATAMARSAVRVSAVPALSDDALVEAAAAVEDLGRTVDALRVAMAAEACERSRPALGADRLSARKGCRTGYELLARLTSIAESTAVRRSKLGEALRVREALSGELIPARFPEVAEAMDGGSLGLDTATAIVNALRPVAGRAEPGMLAVAERALVASALGIDPDTGERQVPFTADQTRIQAVQWQVALDPDGAKPREDHAMIDRGITKIGTRGGVVRYSMALLPEIAGRFDRVCDSGLSPKSIGRFLTAEEREEALESGDSRTPAQQRHDVFAAMLDAAARSGELPTLGGSSPTVLVSVSAEELAEGSGAGWIDGVDDPISIDTVKQFACSGGVQKVFFTPKGRLVGLGSPERTFTPQQRRAISLRDGGCLIPGCCVPAGWCEIHHVTEWAADGPTHTDNGAMLCWFHHRTIDTAGWEIRMIDGVPHIRPPVWLDHDRTWRRASKSRALGSPGRRVPARM